MATTPSTGSATGSRTSSLAVKDGTNTIPTSSTKSTAVARCTFLPLAVAIWTSEIPTSENPVHATFAEFIFHALGCM